MAIYLFKGKSKLERSHIGQIIMSTTLNTQAKVIEQYGGTTWTKIEGRFLLGASSSYPVNATGGEATHTLNIDEMPNHDHLGATEWERYKNLSDGGTNWGVCYATSSPTIANNQGIGHGHAQEPYIAASNDGVHHTHPIAAQGGSLPHNNMPPYKAVYIWERTA